MTQEAMPPQAETISQGTDTPKFKRVSKTRKALMGLGLGIGLFAVSNVYDAVASTHNDRVRDARAQKARIFDLDTAKVTPVIHLDENGEEIPEEGVPIAMNE
jgi:hypothetical protein